MLTPSSCPFKLHYEAAAIEKIHLGLPELTPLCRGPFLGGTLNYLPASERLVRTVSGETSSGTDEGEDSACREHTAVMWK